MTKKFDHLTKPGRIGGLQIKNRMIVSAMGVNLAEADGSCGERIIAYHERQARGGVGLIVLGVTGVAWPHGANQPRQIAISQDHHIPGLQAMAEAVHKHGAKVAAYWVMPVNRSITTVPLGSRPTSRLLRKNWRNL